MGNFLVLADVSNSLVKLLRDKLVPEPITKAEAIGLCSPHEKSDFQLTVHLYNVKENGEFRPGAMQSAGENKLRYPPLSLTLYYLITAHSNTDLKSRSGDEQRILGRAMQVLNDNPILEASDVLGTLADNNEAVQIVFNNLSHEEMAKLWSFPNVPYKLSLSYMVSPVLLESNRVRQVKRVLDTEIKVRQTGGR